MNASFLSAVLIAAAAGWGTAHAATIVGNGGTGTANGDVTAAPTGDGGYYYVSTSGGEVIPGLGVGGETIGSTYTFDAFDAEAGEELSYFFNYLTSDGAGYSDYAYGTLTNVATSEQTLIFTARTTTDGNTVPGFGLPPIAPGVVLDPASSAIIGSYPEDGPVWDKLGDSSGACYQEGCGFTGWIKSTYLVPTAGSYVLTFGVVNYSDLAYQSGLAFAGVKAGGVIIGEPGPSPVPLPAAAPLLLMGLGGIAAARRRHQA